MLLSIFKTKSDERSKKKYVRFKYKLIRTLAIFIASPSLFPSFNVFILHTFQAIVQVRALKVV